MDASRRARRITDSAAEQDRRYAELRERMERIANLSARNRTDAEDVATQAQAAASGLEDMEAATRELETVAEALAEITRRFTGTDGVDQEIEGER